MTQGGTFHDKLKERIVEYILLGYKLLKQFPKEERYEMCSQGRRALTSILFNYVEGYARSKKKVLLNFYEISYGSLQESACVFYLGTRLEYISKEQYLELHTRKEEIAKMLWSSIQGVKRDIKTNGT